MQSLLADIGVTFKLNPRLVRGLDYYTRTVFEWVTDKLGAQSAVCSGGRYDGLIAQLGGRDTPAVGWALGLERIVELVRAEGGDAAEEPVDAYLVAAGDDARRFGFRLVEGLRDRIPRAAALDRFAGGRLQSPVAPRRQERRALRVDRG